MHDGDVDDHHHDIDDVDDDEDYADDNEGVFVDDDDDLPTRKFRQENLNIGQRSEIYD